MFDFSLNHVALSVKDVDKSIEFYKKVFLLKEIENTASNSKTRWLSLGEGKQLHLELIHANGDTEHIALNHTYNAAQIEWFRFGSALNQIKYESGVK